MRFDKIDKTGGEREAIKEARRCRGGNTTVHHGVAVPSLSSTFPKRGCPTPEFTKVKKEGLLGSRTAGC